MQYPTVPTTFLKRLSIVFTKYNKSCCFQQYYAFGLSDTGNNCEKCVEMYYRPANVLQTSESACVPCNCNPAGSTPDPNTFLLDCVMNSDEQRTDGKVRHFIWGGGGGGGGAAIPIFSYTLFDLNKLNSHNRIRDILKCICLPCFNFRNVRF